MLTKTTKEDSLCLDPYVTRHLSDTGNTYLGFRKGEKIGSLGLEVVQIYEHPESSCSWVVLRRGEEYWEMSLD